MSKKQSKQHKRKKRQSFNNCNVNNAKKYLLNSLRPLVNQPIPQDVCVLCHSKNASMLGVYFHEDIGKTFSVPEGKAEHLLTDCVPGVLNLTQKEQLKRLKN